MQLIRILENENSFHRLMHEIDEEMRAENIPIGGRQMEALRRVSERFDCSLRSNSVEEKKISSWFISRYGDRLKISFSPGKTIVKIIGDPYEVNFPLILGTARVHPLQWIKGVTDSTWQLLSENEVNEIVNLIFYMLKQFHSFHYFPRKCIVDLETAVDHVMRDRPAYGLSKWASLQATEKSLKEYIKNKGRNPPHCHDLTELSELAEKLGLPNINRAKINQIQCNAGVRYDDNIVSLNEAVEAHYSSVEVCSQIAKNI